MFERNNAQKHSDMIDTTTERKRGELFRTFIEISDSHGGSLLHNYRFFDGHPFARLARTGTEMHQSSGNMQDIK